MHHCRLYTRRATEVPATDGSDVPDTPYTDSENTIIYPALGIWLLKVCLVPFNAINLRTISLTIIGLQ